MPQSYTLDQLQQMGAKPRSYTLEELQQLGAKETQEAPPPSAAPSFNDERSTGQVAWDQTKAAGSGILGAVTGIPGMVMQGGDALVDALRGRGTGKGQELLKGAAQGFAQPYTTSGRGLVAALGGSAPAPSSQEFAQAAEGAGTQLAGATLPMALSKALTAGRSVAASAAPRLYESALKPGPRSNTLPEVQRMVATGLREGIPVTGRGVTKLDQMVDALNSDIKNTIDTGQNQGVTVNKFKVASRLSDTQKRFANQVNPEADLSTLGESGNEFLRNQPSKIQAAMAQALKQGTYRQLKSRAYGELKGANIESQKALARGLKEELADQLPEIRGMNLRESDLLSLKDELEAAVNRGRNKEMFGIGTPILGGAVGAATGSAPAGVVAGLVRSIIDRPGFKSKLAIALAKAAKP